MYDVILPVLHEKGYIIARAEELPGTSSTKLRTGRSTASSGPPEAMRIGTTPETMRGVETTRY